MEYCDSRKIKEIRDNTAKMADVLTRIADALERLADRKTEPNSSEKPNNCKYAENPSGDVWECGCFLDTYCEHQIYDRNPDGTINIVKCGYEPKDEPQIECENCKHYGTHHPCELDFKACRYEPKDEPQTIVIVKDHGRKQALEMINLYHKLKTELTEREDEPQTDCPWR